MSLAPQELENSASKYAAKAIKFDSQGSWGLAIQAYQRAVEVLELFVAQQFIRVPIKKELKYKLVYLFQNDYNAANQNSY